MTTWRPFIGTLATAAFVSLAFAGPGTAQQKSKTKSVAAAATAPCHASMSDLQGFKNALLQHDLALQGFRTKFRTGSYSTPGSVNRDLAKQKPEELLAATGEALESMADTQTGLLMYAITRKPEKRDVLCVWLIGAPGLLAAETSETLPTQPISLLARLSLRVESRAAARQPRPRKAPAKRSPETPAKGEATAPTMHELSAVLLPPAIRQKLLEMKFTRLLVLPVADVGTVPWPALPLGDGQLVDQSAVVILADIDWILQRQSKVARGPSAAFVVGDPDLSNDPIFEFSPIPASRNEASAIASKWSPSTRLLIGDQADRVEVMSALTGGRPELGLVYFATHGISDSVNPMDGSFLALKGEHLYARDIKNLAMRGRPLVVMSACQTGLGKTFDAGVFGLARAWWQAGAPQVVMSLWNVDDAATNDLMVDFVERVVQDRAGRDGKRLTLAHEEALRQAMLVARARNADPALWASFALFGMPTGPMDEKPRARSVWQ